MPPGASIRVSRLGTRPARADWSGSTVPAHEQPFSHAPREPLSIAYVNGVDGRPESVPPHNGIRPRLPETRKERKEPGCRIPRRSSGDCDRVLCGRWSRGLSGGRVHGRDCRDIFQPVSSPGATSSAGAPQTNDQPPPPPQEAAVSPEPPKEEPPRPAEKPTPGIITDEMLRLNQIAAEKNGVDSPVHPQDFIYWFCCTHHTFTLEAAINYYFWDGGRTAGKLAKVVSGLDFDPLQTIKLLEFASGYGCVTRHLKNNPRIDLTSCDIHPAAVEFLADQIGVKSLQSVHVPEEFSPPEKYDIVFALSFFSHLPKSTFGRWLKTLYSAVRAPGYLIFTTHGLKSCQGLGITPADVPDDGHWFSAHSEQKDLDVQEYGVTLSTPDFVIGEIYRQTGSDRLLQVWRLVGSTGPLGHPAGAMIVVATPSCRGQGSGFLRGPRLVVTSMGLGLAG